MLASMEDERGALPIGSDGRLEALPLTNVAGDHALLIRQGQLKRALLTGERVSGAGADADRDRVVLVPLDDDVELRVDGDAMAVWLARGSVGMPASAVPAWANAIGYLVILALVLFVVVGGVTVVGWLVDALRVS
jgi:hypothetical protein